MAEASSVNNSLAVRIKKLMAKKEGSRMEGAKLKETPHKGELTRSRETATDQELEREVARLQHAAEEARKEAAELRKVLEEKEFKIKQLEKEVESFKKVMNMEVEVKVPKDLKKKNDGAFAMEKKKFENSTVLFNAAPRRYSSYKLHC